MPVYASRIQCLITEAQYRELLRISKKQHKPLSQLVREAIEEVYLRESATVQRRKALQELLSLQAPVADWGQMEKEIASGAVGG